jgi:hypothetical protein
VSWRALKHSHTRTPSPQGAQPLKWPATTSIYRWNPKLDVTLKSCKNRGLADCPPHRARIVCHFKPYGYILNKCYSKSTVTARVDGPPHKWRTVRSSFGHPIQKDRVSAPVLGFKGERSAPQGPDGPQFNLDHYPEPRTV